MILIRGDPVAGRQAAIQRENKNVSNSAEHANRLAIEGGEPVRKDPLP